MGAQSFIHTVEASSAREAYESLVAEARHNRGHDSYNGTISTCSMGRCRQSYASPTKANEKKAYQYIEDHDNGQKWTADYIDLGVVKYVKTSVKKVVRTYDAKYKQKFCVINMENGRRLDACDTKGEADEKAMKHTLDGKWVTVIKDMVKLSGNNTVSEFKVETKTYTSKPKINKSEKHVRVNEIHKYIFYGWASC